MEATKNIINHAEQRCKESGARLTEKRKQVLSLLLESSKALSAYELVDAYKREFGDALPAMSMYRILEFLENEQFVHRLALANKYIACEHIHCDHSHTQSQFLICNQCQKVKEIFIDKPTMESLKNHVVDTGFNLVNPQLEMSCVCDSCLNSNT